MNILCTNGKFSSGPPCVWFYWDDHYCKSDLIVWDIRTNCCGESPVWFQWNYKWNWMGWPSADLTGLRWLVPIRDCYWRAGAWFLVLAMTLARFFSVMNTLHRLKFIATELKTWAGRSSDFWWLMRNPIWAQVLTKCWELCWASSLDWASPNQSSRYWQWKLVLMKEVLDYTLVNSQGAVLMPRGRAFNWKIVPRNSILR